MYVCSRVGAEKSEALCGSNKHSVTVIVKSYMLFFEVIFKKKTTFHLVLRHIKFSLYTYIYIYIYIYIYPVCFALVIYRFIDLISTYIHTSTSHSKKS
jgi:hypothetical protein